MLQERGLAVVACRRTSAQRSLSTAVVTLLQTVGRVNTGALHFTRNALGQGQLLQPLRVGELAQLLVVVDVQGFHVFKKTRFGVGRVHARPLRRAHYRKLALVEGRVAGSDRKGRGGKEKQPQHAGATAVSHFEIRMFIWTGWKTAFFDLLPSSVMCTSRRWPLLAVRELAFP